MLVKGDVPKLLLAGMRTNFMKQYEQAEREHERITTTINSGKSSETYPWLGGVPKMKEWKDERVPEGMKEHNYTVLNRDFESSIAIDRNAIEDEQYGQIEVRVRELATEAARFFDEMAFTLINQGDQTEGVAGTIYQGVDLKCYDGSAFFAEDHDDGAGDQSNKGDQELSSVELQKAITAMRKFKNDKGKPAHVNPNLLVVPNELEWTARELLNSAYYPEETGDGKTKLATNVLQGVVGLAVNTYLDKSKSWYLFDTNRVVNPLILQMRKDPTFSSLTEGTESSFMRKKLYFGVDWRGEILWGDWRTGYGSIPGE